MMDVTFPRFCNNKMTSDDDEHFFKDLPDHSFDFLDDSLDTTMFRMSEAMERSTAGAAGLQQLSLQFQRSAYLEQQQISGSAIPTQFHRYPQTNQLNQSGLLGANMLHPLILQDTSRCSSAASCTNLPPISSRISSALDNHKSEWSLQEPDDTDDSSHCCCLNAPPSSLLSPTLSIGTNVRKVGELTPPPVLPARINPTSTTLVTHVHGEPSEYSSVPSENDQEDSSSMPSLLHQACQFFPTTAAVASSALQVDPRSIRRRLILEPCPRDPCEAPAKRQKLVNGHYSYAINAALKHNASLEVLQLLATAGPDVLVKKDGHDSCGSLTLALYQRRQLDVVELLVQANPECVKVADRYSNLPLHVACSVGSSLEVVTLLASTFPDAMNQRNFHGHTPLDIAQRNTICSDQVIDYLQGGVLDHLEDEAVHLDSDVD